jgi:hypothetical protein
MVKQCKAGKPVNMDDLPPEVAIGSSSAPSQPSISKSLPVSAETPDTKTEGITRYGHRIWLKNALIIMFIFN